ncbi:MAG: thioesterase family protein [Acidobacteria bacterium]|nr:thioesterase family protein [Acidobacteriota bacterium]
MYEKTLYAGWGDMDFNSHMKNTAFLDKSADVRMIFFSENGFSMSEFSRLNIGPVIMKDELEYYREVKLLQEIKVRLFIAGLSEDGSRFLMCNEFYRLDEKLSARITSAGGWLDLKERRLVTPPRKLLEILQSLPKTNNFQSLPTGVR